MPSTGNSDRSTRSFALTQVSVGLLVLAGVMGATTGIVTVAGAQAAEAPSDAGTDEAASRSEPLNGFSIDPQNESKPHIRRGGPARDAIHSVDAPEFVPAAEASWAPPPVAAIGVEIGGEARAYPIHLMEYHQIVNDSIAGVPVAVTYDPLTGIAIVWKRTIDDGRVLEFGVSGLLYREQFLMHDRETDSLWAQYEGVAIAGPLSGKRLERVPSRQEPVGAWMGRHPSSGILKRPARMKIDYRHSPFEAYWTSESVPVTVRASDERYHPKELVLGIEANGKHRAYLGSILTAEGGRIVDTFEGHKIRIAYDRNLGLFIYEAPNGVWITDAYWFAWKSLHPDTEIWHDRVSQE
jgi:hypothetical protein